MKTKTIAARTKCIVAALILSMSIGVMPVYAVTASSGDKCCS